MIHVSLPEFVLPVQTRIPCEGKSLFPSFIRVKDRGSENAASCGLQVGRESDGRRLLRRKFCVFYLSFSAPSDDCCSIYEDMRDETACMCVCPLDARISRLFLVIHDCKRGADSISV